MSRAINALLGFLTEYWFALLCGLGGLISLVLLRKAWRAIAKPRGSVLGPRIQLPSAEPRNGPGARTVRTTGRSTSDDADSMVRRYQSLVEDTKADNGKLRDRISHLTQMMRMLAPLIKELSANVDRRHMGPIVLRVLERIFSPKQAMVFFVDGDGETMTLGAQLGARQVPEGFHLGIGDGFAGLVARKKLLLTKEDLAQESNLVRRGVMETEPEEFQTDIATPILHRGEVLGVLCMGGVKEDSEEDRDLFALIADMTALALTNYLQYRKIEEYANSDPLTLICNKGRFLEICDEELPVAARSGEAMSILMLDVDHFKNYNDTHGHLAGDRLLKSLADLLKSMVRERDLIARFGGEEFIVLLRGIRDEDAVQAAERMRRAVADHPFKGRETQPLSRLSVSVGVAWMPQHGTETRELIEKADAALYAAKNSGRNRVETASRRVEVISFTE